MDGATQPTDTRIEAVYVEAGAKRVFMAALAWPGWCRSGRTEELSAKALVTYGSRYRIAMEGSIDFVPIDDVASLAIVERLAGGAGTDFGVPSGIPEADRRPVAEAGIERLLRILGAAWSTFDGAVEAGRGRSLRTGPRGGGRDLARIIEHVAEAEVAYLSKLGVRRPARAAAVDDPELRRRSQEAFRVRALDLPLADPTAVAEGWPPLYFARRSAWHLLDHAWEIQDRIELG